MSSPITQANHHPYIENSLGYRRVLINNSLREKRWADALGQINESLNRFGNWYLNCRECQVLKAPLLREKSLCTLMLGDRELSERQLIVYDDFMEFIRRCDALQDEERRQEQNEGR